MYYNKLTDEQIGLMINHRVAIAELVACGKCERFLTETLGKVHAVTVDFRLKHYLPAQERERLAQELAQDSYNILTA